MAASRLLQGLEALENPYLTPIFFFLTALPLWFASACALTLAKPRLEVEEAVQGLVAR